MNNYTISIYYMVRPHDIQFLDPPLTISFDQLIFPNTNNIPQGCRSFNVNLSKYDKNKI